MTPRPAQGREEMEDRTLAERAGGGDAAAFQALVTRHLPGVLGLARRMLNDPAEADDVAQETLLRLWRSGGAIEIGPGGLRPWLRRIAANLCIDRLRAVGRTVVTDELPEQSVAPSQLKDVEGLQLSERVSSALKALPDRQRQALALFHYEGMSHLEIAGAMGITSDAVESLLARARRTLRVTLAEDWRSFTTAGPE